MNEEKNQKVLAIVLVIAVIVLFGYKLFFNKNNKNNIDTETIELVKDNNKFFTVAGCIDKYLINLSSDNTENVLILLDEMYKKNNNINSNNLYSFIKKIDNYYGFITKKMYVQRESKSKYKYYVYGLIEKGIEDSYKNYDDYYVIVTLDESNLTFSVQPYDGEMFNK